MNNPGVGLIGAGYISSFHFAALADAGMTVSAVCDMNATLARDMADHHGVARWYSSVDELLEDDGIGSVHVLTPPQTHGPLIAQALDAGRNVLVEKPMATSLGHVEQIGAALAHSEGRLGVSFNFLFSEPFDKLANAIHQGEIGTIQHIDAVWNRPLGQLQASSHRDWMLQARGNIMFETGPHLQAAVLHLLGASPQIVSSHAMRPKRLSNGADFYQVWETLLVSGDTTVRLRTALDPGYPEFYVTVHGSAGTATADLESDTFSLVRETGHMPDVDRYVAQRRAARSVARTARHSLLEAVKGHAGLQQSGSPFGRSVLAAMRAFYSPGQLDPRLSFELGASVVELGTTIVDQTAFSDPVAVEPATTPQSAMATTTEPDVLVLGATGFIGRSVVRALVHGGHQVRAVVRDPRSFPSALTAMGVQVVKGDLADLESLRAALSGVTAVVHLAKGDGATQADFERTDVGPTEAFARAAVEAGVGCFVYASSIVVYHAGLGPDQVITEDTEPHPSVASAAPYAWSKFENERRLNQLRHQAGLPLVIVRPGVVLGAGSDPRHFGVAAWPARTVAQFYGDGTSELPTVLVHDVADAIVRCIDVDEAIGQSFNLVAPCGLTAADYVDELEKAAGEKIVRQRVPTGRSYALAMGKWIIKQAAGKRDAARPTSIETASRSFTSPFDGAKAEAVLGWKPERSRQALIQQGIIDAVHHQTG